MIRRALAGLALALALGGCVTATRYAGHSHDGSEMHLDCDACAQAVRADIVRMFQQGATAPVGSN